MTKIKSTIATVVTVLVGAISILGLLEQFNTLKDREFGVFFIIIIFAMGLVAMFILSKNNYLSRINKFININYKKIIIPLILLMFLSQIAVSISLLSTVHWDVEAVEVTATNYIDGHRSEQDMHYLAKYDNNIPITLLAVYIIKIASVFNINSHLSLYIVNGAMLFCAGILTVFSVKNVLGKTASIVAYALSFVFITFFPYAATFYTDTVGLFFVSLILFSVSSIYNIMKSNKLPNNKNLYIISSLLGFSVSIGMLIKITSFIATISAVLIFLLLLILNFKNTIKFVKSFKIPIFITVGSFLGGLIIYQGLFILAPNFARFSDEYIYRYRVSAVHYLAMGSLRGLEPYPECQTGGYCTQYVDHVHGELSNIDDKNKYSTSILKKNIEKDFPYGYTEFMVDKVKTSFGDGSFGVWGEGNNDRVKYHINNKSAYFIRNYVSFDGKYFQNMKSFWGTIWLGCLISIFMLSIYMVKNRKKINVIFLWLAVSVIGLALYQALFESRARYIYLFLPFFILLAAWGVVCLYKFLFSLKKLNIVKIVDRH